MNLIYRIKAYDEYLESYHKSGFRRNPKYHFIHGWMTFPVLALVTAKELNLPKDLARDFFMDKFRIYYSERIISEVTKRVYKYDYDYDTFYDLYTSLANYIHDEEIESEDNQCGVRDIDEDREVRYFELQERRLKYLSAKKI